MDYKIRTKIARILLDDAVDDGQAHAGSFALRFGGEEGIENPFHGLLVHAPATIFHRQFQVIPRREAGRSVVAQLQRRKRNPDQALAKSDCMGCVCRIPGQ